MNETSKPWYDKLKKSPLSPPDWVFSVVWPILYALMLIAFLMVWSNSKCFPLCLAAVYFIIQLVLNLSWSPTFFVNRRPDIALVILLALIFFVVLTIQEFFKIDENAAYLMIPYLIWLLFALYLNSYIVFNNERKTSY